MNDKLYAKVIEYDFKKLFVNKGYAYFTNGNFNINIIGVRAKGASITNRFDDIILLDYKNEKGEWCRQAYKATTDPGLYYMKSLMSKKGCAIVVPGQYRGVWQIGLHKGKYQALVQRKSIKVYRDANLNDIYDLNPKTIENGVFGINLHKAGANSIQVDKWSAGCQVIARERDFNQLMSIVKKQSSNTYTYTLLREEDL